MISGVLHGIRKIKKNNSLSVLNFMSLLMLSKFIPAPVFEGAGFLPALKLHDPTHAVFKLSVLEQILNNLQLVWPLKNVFTLYLNMKNK